LLTFKYIGVNIITDANQNLTKKEREL